MTSPGNLKPSQKLLSFENGAKDEEVPCHPRIQSNDQPSISNVRNWFFKS